MIRMEVIVGKVYRHFLGKYYRVLFIASDSTTPKGEPLNEFFQKHSVIIITNWSNVVRSYWVVGE